MRSRVSDDDLASALARNSSLRLKRFVPRSRTESHATSLLVSSRQHSLKRAPSAGTRADHPARKKGTIDG